MQKTPRKNTIYKRDEIILKIGHLAKAITNAKAIDFENGEFRSIIKNAKNMLKTILQ